MQNTLFLVAVVALNPAFPLVFVLVKSADFKIKLK